MPTVKRQRDATFLLDCRQFSSLRCRCPFRRRCRFRRRRRRRRSPSEPRCAIKPHPKLHHEDLDAYRVAIEFLAVAATLLAQYPRGHAGIADQLRRAALSIPLNIAEGYGKRGRDDRARFYDIARGSAHECGAILDASKVLGIVNEETFGRGKALLYRVVSMLVKMAG